MQTKKEVNQLAYDILNAAIEVHRTIGPGLIESIYEACLIKELELRGFDVKQQEHVTIHYKGLELDAHLRCDLLVNDTIIVENKAVQELHPVFEAKLLSYMKMLKKPKGLIINFFTSNIIKSMKPMVNEYYAALPD
jgi:GxxExxY protein